MLTGCGTSLAASASVRRTDPSPSPSRTTVDLGSAEGTDPAPAGHAARLLDTFYKVPVPLEPAPPGAIIRSSMIRTAGRLPTGATAYRVLYHSQSMAGTDIAVSGVIVVPGGPPPAGGFPIVSWAHGTTGVADPCAPSLGSLSSIAYLGPLLKARMIVVATDYQGLGTPGIHPYLVGQSEAQGVLDAARAARNLEGRAASNTVVVIGYSQGGQAALFAGQIAQSYAPELYLAGVVAIGPVTSVTELAPHRTRRSDRRRCRLCRHRALRVVGDLRQSAAGLGVHQPGTRRLVGDRLVVRGDGGCGVRFHSHQTAVPLGVERQPGAAGRRRCQRAREDARPSPRSWSSRGRPTRWSPTRTTTGLVDRSLCRAEHDTVRYVPIPGASHSGALQEGAAGHPAVDLVAGGRRGRGRHLRTGEEDRPDGWRGVSRRGSVRRRGSDGRRRPSRPRRPPRRPHPPGCRCRPLPIRPGTSGR